MNATRMQPSEIFVKSAVTSGTAMQHLARVATSLAFGLALTFAAPPASAAPVAPPPAAAASVLVRARLAPEADKALRAAVTAARAADAGAFREVEALVARTPELNRKARSGKAAVALALAAMGARAVMPLAELAALEPPAGVSPEALRAARLAVVEALGMLRDARVAPVLRAWLEQGDLDATRTAAEAVARLDTEEAAGWLLTALASASGERAIAVLSGMGMCHRASVAKALADRLGAAPDEATARAAVKSLRKVAAPWAWQTLAHREDEAVVRDVASRALVGAWLRSDGETRDAAEKALLVVDDGRVTQFVQNARMRAPRAQQDALDALAARLASRAPETIAKP
jgi:hypothetical protein